MMHNLHRTDERTAAQCTRQAGALASWPIHVSMGMLIGVLALVGLSLLLAACGAKPAGEILTPTPTGQSPAVLLLGTPAAVATQGAEATAAEAQAELTAQATPEAPAAPETTPVATEPPTQEYVVQPGDSLLALAEAWGVPMAAIQRANGMGDSTVVKVGETLVVPSPAGWEAASRFWVLHVVKSGETLGGIAKAYGLDMASLQSVNELANANAIVVGQELIVPLQGPASVAAPEPTAAPAPLPTSEPTATMAETGSADEGETQSEAALAVDVPAAAPAPAEVVPPPADVADWPHEVFRLINEIRAQYGLPAYTYNDVLAQAAQAHANECFDRGWCSHYGLDGSNIKDRVRRAGYQGTGWAECWAQQASPQAAVDMWMNETPPNDPHRKMMLHTWVTEIGIGITKAPYGCYFIADFGRP